MPENIRYTVLENFKAGLDRRRSILTSVPGSLYQLQNGHINQGGEVEKRQQFNPSAASYPSWTFGIEPDSTGIRVFGSFPLTNAPIIHIFASGGTAFVYLNTYFKGIVGQNITIAGLTGVGAPLNGTWAVTAFTNNNAGSGDNFVQFNSASTIADTDTTVGTMTYTVTLPTGVTYEQLVHPDLFNQYPLIQTEQPGGLPGPNSYQPTLHDMVSLVTCNFNGIVFAAVKFTDGFYYLYYNGTPVWQSVNGLVRQGGASVAAILAGDFINAVAQQLPGWTAALQADGKTVLLSSPNGVSFVGTASTANAGGATRLVHELTVMNENQVQNFTAASASFAVVNGAAGTDTFTLTAFSDAGGTVPVTLCSGVVCGSTSGTTAQLIANAINAASATTGYSASAITSGGSGNVIVTAPPALGAVTFNLTVTVTGAANAIAATATPLMTVTVPAFVSKIGQLVSATVSGLVWKFPFNSAGKQVIRLTSKKIVTAGVTALVSGGSGSYTFVWQEQFLGSGNGIVIQHPYKQITTFKATVQPGQSVSGTFVVVVTDTTGKTATSGVCDVYLENPVVPSSTNNGALYTPSVSLR